MKTNESLYLPGTDMLGDAPITKGELAARLYPDSTYDCALPQAWVDAMRERGWDEVTGQFVWGYAGGDMSRWGAPWPLTVEAVRILTEVARWV